jgi:hypothetical protein
LSKMGEYDQIHGLISWISNTFNSLQSKNPTLSHKIAEIKKLSLISELESVGSYESAIFDYTDELKKENFNHLNEESKSLFFNQIFECYKKISDFDGISKALSSFPDLNENWNLEHQHSYSDLLKKYEQEEDISQEIKKVKKFNDVIEFSKLEMLKSVKLNDNSSLDFVKFQLGHYLTEKQFSKPHRVLPAMIQLFCLNVEDFSKENVLIPKIEQKLTRIDFLNDLKFAYEIENKNQEMIEKISLKQCKLSTEKKNLTFAESLLENISSEFTSNYLKANIMLQKDSQEEAIEILCKLVQRNDLDNHLYSKIYLDLENWISKNPERRKQIVEIELNFVEKDIQEYLLESSMKYSDQMRDPLIRYANWCIEKANSLINNQFIVNKENMDNFSISMKNELLSEEDLKNMMNFLFQCSSQTFFTNFDDYFSKNFELKNIFINEFKSKYPFLKSHSESLFTTWNSFLMNIFQIYQKAIDSYFKALQISKSNNDKLREGNVMITLRLIKLFIQHPTQLESQIKEGIKNSKSQVWVDIIPQLLTHLSNPNQIIIETISQLLIDIGKKSPSILCYPLVVGSISKNGPSKQYEDVITAIKSQNDELFDNVEVVVRELTRLTIFYEEMWYNNLMILLKKFKIQINQFKESCQHIASLDCSSEEKNYLKNGKYVQFFSPIIISLETNISLTTSYPETRHEYEFQEKYESVLVKIVQKLKNPSKDEELEKIYDALHSLTKSFVSVYRKNNLRMKDLSPILSKLNFQNVPIPGAEMEHIDSNSYPTIVKFQDAITILTSKTKPKKISLLDSNGTNHTFLIKGTEDLHLDERIMQFLKIINLSLLHSKETRNLRARHYAVIPLGESSGLIKWVDDAIPLYTTYKNWCQMNKKAVKRPVDTYYQTLVSMLKEKGITSLARPYPKDISMNVIKKLISETPKNLLSKELWFNSSNLPEWWSKSKSFNRSLGVMSIIGYIIGLGDRHLDKFD